MTTDGLPGLSEASAGAVRAPRRGLEMNTDRKGRMKRGKDCRRCNATGKRIRIGRWLYNRWARIYRAGTP
ncbi:hypothetical protein [Streptomyces sp. NPDC014995]|uniref:hypothetical protein n=1 Tax=Streptomyces sp. NPDC014995 TaxID=3364936 RepID=UPI0037022FDA